MRIALPVYPEFAAPDAIARTRCSATDRDPRSLLCPDRRCIIGDEKGLLRLEIEHTFDVARSAPCTPDLAGGGPNLGGTPHRRHNGYDLLDGSNVILMDWATSPNVSRVRGDGVRCHGSSGPGTWRVWV